MLPKICKYAEKLFMRYGIKSITMDDVSRELSISKKTLYQYVEDKDDLVKKTISLHLEEIDKMVIAVFSQEGNAIQQMLNIGNMMVGMHKEVGQGLIFDLKKYHSESYIMLTEHREKTMFTQIVQNIHLGIKQKLYKKEVNVDITTGFYMALVFNCIDSEVSILQKNSFNEKYTTLIHYHLNAICTSEGIDYLNKNKKNLINLKL